jgi:hypothetical protein
MRKIANLGTPVEGIHRLMILDGCGGAFLYLYLQAEDGTCDYDEWYESVEQAEASVRDRFNVHHGDWIDIGDAPDDSRDDWIGYSPQS